MHIKALWWFRIAARGVLGWRTIGTTKPNLLSARSDRFAAVAIKALSPLCLTASRGVLRCGVSQQARYTGSSNSLRAR